MRQPLYKDVDISTMRSMREEQGMSNTEIAEALGVTRETVWRYLGAGPHKPYRKPEKPAKQIVPRKSVEELFEEVKTHVTLVGKQFVYEVDPHSQTVAFNLTKLDAEKLDALIEELQYIRRMYMR